MRAKGRGSRTAAIDCAERLNYFRRDTRLIERSVPKGIAGRLPVACWLCAALLVTSVAVGQEIPENSPVANALQRADAAILRIVERPDAERTFENTLGAIDDLIVRLRLETEVMQLMAYVSPEAAVRAQGRQAEEDIQSWLIALGKREDLYKAVTTYADTDPQLAGEQKRLLQHTLRDYRRAGMTLPAERREKLKEVQLEINRLGLEFQKNIREDETRVVLTVEELKGAPNDVLETLERSGDLYLCGMDYPTFLPIMDHCELESTRHKMYVAYKRRGGNRNVEVLERILKLRAEAAELLGYAHPADYETEIRMAKNAQNVRQFYDALRLKVRAKALEDLEEFTAAKREHTGDAQAKLHPWDQSFYEKRLLKEKYAVDSEKVREYLPMERVIEGLFSITQSLYGLEYRNVTDQAVSRGRPIWHPDVKLYEVWDKESGELLGEFYLDLHPRPNKYNHAAQWGLFPRKVWSDGTVQKPLAALVCNFTKPTAEKPSLLSHNEIETFFHEFGHCLHSILSATSYGEFSGTAVARDFVEAPSQMFENWVWDARVLKTFARHYQTGKTFPDELLEGMVRARYLGSGLNAEHQFFYGLVDLEYHTATDGKVDTTQTGLRLFGEVELYELVPGTHFQASFGHLVGYQAGYYGYMWSLVYAQDMFERFKELGMLDPEAGRYYREKILARGGTMDELEMVTDYLGRKPRMDAFLEHLGLGEQ